MDLELDTYVELESSLKNSGLFSILIKDNKEDYSIYET